MHLSPPEDIFIMYSRAQKFAESAKMLIIFNKLRGIKHNAFF